MKKMNTMEMRAVEGGKTYYYVDYCPYCGIKITGQASGWAILSPFVKVMAKNNFYEKLNNHAKKKHGWA